MSTPTPDKTSLPEPSYHWTTLKARVFLAAMVEFGRVGEAARAAGMGRQSAYRLRARLGDEPLRPDMGQGPGGGAGQAPGAGDEESDKAAAGKRHFRARKVTPLGNKATLRRQSDRISPKSDTNGPILAPGHCQVCQPGAAAPGG